MAKLYVSPPCDLGGLMWTSAVRPGFVRIRCLPRDVQMMSYSAYSLILAAFTIVFALFLLWMGKTPLSVYYQHLLNEWATALDLRRRPSFPDVDPALIRFLEETTRHGSRGLAHEVTLPGVCALRATLDMSDRVRRCPLRLATFPKLNSLFPADPVAVNTE
ncbi:hypothetical protein ECG_02934 [Echinococcus granulosus]|uniref:Expressed protein n=1 Tax=Echinococcus granulosus TaxID=6210 RepID=A0A068WJ28_ECHGR|nr:hypothetical protein ECG_02934 [Echinococcus granulosus]CDS20100.1 expressed protein [Echinococcus granulosus]